MMRKWLYWSITFLVLSAIWLLTSFMLCSGVTIWRVLFRG